jgi:hypothetical protein
MLPIISGPEGDRIKIEVTVDLSGFMLELLYQAARFGDGTSICRSIIEAHEGRL